MNTIKTIVILMALLNVSSAVHAQPAPDWELKDAAGNTVRLADFRGKPLIMHFWATWCPYCKKLQPELDRLYLKYRDQGLALIAVSFREDEGAEPQTVLEKRGHHFKTLVNGDEVARLYGIKGTPTTLFMDKIGRIVLTTSTSNADDPTLEETARLLLELEKNN